MKVPDDLEAMRGRFAPLMKEGEAATSPTAECLSEDLIAALAEGSGGPDLRAQAMPHVAGCPRCRRAVAGVARLLADPEVVAELPAPPPAARAWKRWAGIALPLAAAATLLVLVWPRAGAPGDLPRHRGSVPAAGPAATYPLGVVAEARRLRWHEVPGASRYRVTIFDAKSEVVFTGELSDTLLSLPDSIVLQPGAMYLWIVEARTGWNRWVASAPAEFVLVPESAP